MVRVLACAAALVSLCSAVRAERIQIVGVVANYVTARDVVDIEIWLDRPLNVQTDFLSFTGATPDLLKGNGGMGAVFGFSNGTRWTDDIRPEFDLTTRLYTGTQQNPIPQPRVITEDIPVLRRDAIRLGELRHVVSISFSADAINLDDMRLDPANVFLFNVNVYTPSENGDFWRDSVSDYSTIDRPIVTHAPEPSTFVLLGIAAIHLIGLPRLRHRFGKRHVGREV